MRKNKTDPDSECSEDFAIIYKIKTVGLQAKLQREEWNAISSLWLNAFGRTCSGVKMHNTYA